MVRHYTYSLIRYFLYHYYKNCTKKCIQTIQKGATIMAKKKSGSIAVPFLVTIFISLIVVGGTALWFYKYFGFGSTETPPEPTPRTGQTISVEDNHTILLILDEPEQRCSSTFVLMRSLPVKKELIFIGLPTNMISLVDGKQERLKECYDRGGASSAVEFVQKAFEISIDRYMKFDSASLQKVCDYFGGAPAAFVPDNLKAAVVKADRVEPVIQENAKGVLSPSELAILFHTGSCFRAES